MEDYAMTMLSLVVLLQAAWAQEETKRSFDALSSEEWADADAAVGQLAKDWGTTWKAEEGHAVTGAVENPDETGVAYFTTTRDNGEGGTQLSVFRYSNGYFWRLWRNDDAGDTAWRVVGYDDGKVVYAETAADYASGECEELLVTGSEGNGVTLWTLPDGFDRSWDEGPTAYTPAQEDVDAARERQTQCEGGA